MEEIEIDLQRVFFIHDRGISIDIDALKKDCLHSFETNNRMSKDVSDTRNEDLVLRESKTFNDLIKTIKDKFYTMNSNGGGLHLKQGICYCFHQN